MSRQSNICWKSLLMHCSHSVSVSFFCLWMAHFRGKASSRHRDWTESEPSHQIFSLWLLQRQNCSKEAVLICLFECHRKSVPECNTNLWSILICVHDLLTLFVWEGGVLRKKSFSHLTQAAVTTISGKKVFLRIEIINVTEEITLGGVKETYSISPHSDCICIEYDIEYIQNHCCKIIIIIITILVIVRFTVLMN